MKVLFSKKGFSLIEIMVAIVILGIISVSVATGFTSLFRQKAQFITESEVHNIQNAIATYLYNNASCSAEFSGKPLPKSYWTDLKLTHYRGFGDWSGSLEKNSDLGRMKIEKLSIRKKPGSLTDSFNDGVTGYRIYIAQVKIQFKLTHQGSKLFSPFYIELPIFTKSPYEVIDSCYSGVKLPYFCAALDLSYNPATHTCSSRYQCLLRGFYSREYCPGKTECKASSSAKVNSITNGYSCPSGVSPIKIGLYSNDYTESCGKKCTRDVQRRIESYICMDCR